LLDASNSPAIKAGKQFIENSNIQGVAHHQIDRRELPKGFTQMKASDFLIGVAQIALTFAGFAGVVSVFRPSTPWQQKEIFGLPYPCHIPGSDHRKMLIRQYKCAQ